MANHIVLVESKKDWLPNFPQEVTVVTASSYLQNATIYKQKGEHVINLCRSYKYLSMGYYSSLLAEARKHRVIPSIRTITDLSSRAIYSLNVENLDRKIENSFKKFEVTTEKKVFDILIVFGVTEFPELNDLARQIFDLFRCPILRVEFRFHEKWVINNIKTVSIHSLDGNQQELFVSALNRYLSKRWRTPRMKGYPRYDLAVLYNPREQLPPSDMVALKRFIRAGKKLDINVELIEKKDYGRLAEYDALFIRETTSIDHYTYRFAKKAESEGMVVLDDPDSIIRCTNKVFLAELLKSNNIPAPQSVILQKGEALQLGDIMKYPVVLKIPDGSFSRGIYKAENEQQAKEISERLFKESDLILAQEYLYTRFDWRVGILNDEPLFACQYFMSKDHWQIVKYDESGSVKEGAYKAWSISDAPQSVVDIATSAARLIGNGLYGVDVKQDESGNVYVIEVNDNPNVESGVEDACMGNLLYEKILLEFIRRIEINKGISNVRS